MSASKNLGKVFMTPKGIWDKTLNYTKLDIVTNKVGKISCGYIATTDIEKNIEITDNRWLKLFELLDGDLTEEYKAVQMDVANKATDVDANKKAVDLIYSQMQKLYDVEISTTTPTNERTGLWINPDDISGVINIPEIKDDEVSDVDTWSSKKIDNVTGSLKEDISNKITKFYASSQGENHLADSDNGKIMDMVLYGKSEQKQYSGKNLLNPILQTTTKNGVTCTANGDGTYTLNGTATANTAFILSGDILSLFGTNKKLKMIGTPKGGASNSYRIQMWRQLDVPDELYDYGDGVEILAPTGNHNIAIWITNKFVCNNLIFKPMIVDASLYPDATYDDFEPYTGGIPSPNPDYPQEIKSVVNPTVKVCGKNLWDNFKTLSSGNVEQKNGTYIATTSTMQVDLTPGSVGVRPLLLKANNTYTFSLKTTVSISSNKYVCLTYTNGKNKNIIFNNKNFIKFVPERDVEKIGFILYGSVAGDKAYDVQLEMGSEATSYEPYHEQTVTLPYTLNAIPVSSGGNVTIDGQQYIADYVDVERGKRVQRIIKYKITGDENIYEHASGWIYCDTNLKLVAQMCATNIAKTVTDQYILSGNYIRSGATGFYFTHNDVFTDVNAFKNYVKNNDVYVYAVLQTPKETDLTKEEITAFKALATYYPTTNISINSEQLDGYTVFNYPISMQNGWNYVKQQIGDTREYIYDIDARTQDTDLQAAEAYVNSEYAVALTELEV